MTSLSLKLNDLWLNPQNPLFKSEARMDTTLLHEAFRYPPIQKLYIQANKVAKALTNFDLEVVTVPSNWIQQNGRLLYTEHSVKVLLKDTLTWKDALTVLIQELANTIYLQRIIDVFKKSSNPQSNMQEFVVDIERIEFDATQIYNKILEELNRFSPEIFGSFPKGFDCFGDFLKHQQTIGHTKSYERYWSDQRVRI
jgi:hypothetical protein